MKQLIKISIAVIIACSYTIPSFAQESGKQNTISDQLLIGITGGLSSPSGNYTKTAYDDAKSGFAGAGYNFGITGTWLFKKNFGISLLASYHQFSFKGTQNMVNGFQDGFDVDSASFTVKGTNHTINVLIGPYYSIPVTDRLFIDIRAMIGITAATLAGNDVWLEDSGNLFNFSQKQASATTLGMQGGAGVRYNFTPRLGLMINADYFYSKPDFSITNVNRNNNAGRMISSYNEAISGINTNLTLLYTLKKF